VVIFVDSIGVKIFCQGVTGVFGRGGFCGKLGLSCGLTGRRASINNSDIDLNAYAENVQDNAHHRRVRGFRDQFGRAASQTRTTAGVLFQTDHRRRLTELLNVLPTILEKSRHSK